MSKLNFEQIINKKIKQFEDKNINIDISDINIFLKEVYFLDSSITEENLNNFLHEDNTKEIIDFLMVKAIINPIF